MDDKDIAIVLANVMKTNFDHYINGKRVFDFVGDLTRENQAFNNSKNITSAMLRATYNFADSFFDGATHGFPDMDKIPWEDATQLMILSIDHLITNQEITDPRILRYM